MSDADIVRQLPVGLTQEEVEVRRAAVVRLLGEIDIEKADHAREKHAHKERIADLQGALDSKLKQVRERAEVRAVRCRERPSFETNSVVTYRCDTGEVIEERPMTAEQRQLELDADPPPVGEDEWGDPAGLGEEGA